MGGFRRRLRPRMNRPHGKVPESELNPAVVLHEKVFQRALDLLAVGALKV